MLLAFYTVDNEQNYDRHTFDLLDDKPQEIIDMLAKLSDDELSVFDMDNPMDIFEFQETYNDEYLDGGWWCVVINNTKGAQN